MSSKGLSLTQPWASLIAHGHKRVETRSWSTKYRGEIFIHASKGFPGKARYFAGTQWAEGRLPAELPLGCLIATARIVDVKPTEDAIGSITELERSFGDYGPGRYAWFLEDIKPFRVFVPFKGALGLFNLEPPETILNKR